MVFVRGLINNLRSQGKAILLSSHILTEVQSIADRVAIISHGKLLKVLTRSDLKNLGKDTIFIAVDNPNDELANILKRFGEPRIEGQEVTIRDLLIPRERYTEISSELVNRGYRLRNFQAAGENLEEYFFAMVGEKL